MAQVRIGTSLSDGEKNHLKGRKPCVQQCLEKNNIPCTLGNVPNIAILGSGGGERAMVGMLGSLSKLAELGLLDAALYMSGVSGATWCMASVYEKPNWSSDIKQIKSVVERIGHGSVSLRDQISLLKKYHRTNANFSLTDVWTALVVPMVVKKIDESTLSNYQTGQDPYPIYTIIDQDCKYEGFIHESFFELTPHEAGYTLAGAFVETSSFGSIFNKGVLREKKPEMDMTYLQGVCGSALADKEVILKKLKEWLENLENRNAIKDHEGLNLLHDLVDLHLTQLTHGDPTLLLQSTNALLLGKRDLNDLEIQFNFNLKTSQDQDEQIDSLTSTVCQSFFQWYKDLENEELVVFVKALDKVNEKPPNKPAEGEGNANNEEKHLKVLIDIVKVWAEELQSHDGPKILAQMLELNYCILRGEQWTQLVDELNALLTGKKTESGGSLRIDKDEWVQTEHKSRKIFALGLTLDICIWFFSWFPNLNFIWRWIVKKILKYVEELLNRWWIWGTNYNFLYDMNVPQVHQKLQESKTSHFEDAGLLVNSPYMSALRTEREIDLIISFDFSAGDPMETVTQTSHQCKEFDIPFPAINVTKCDSTSPKKFYVFKGLKKAPTVIHMPLFNVENCGSKLKLDEYRKKYGTFQLPYSPEMIEDLMEKAGENIINNKENLLREIESIVKQK